MNPSVSKRVEKGFHAPPESQSSPHKCHQCNKCPFEHVLRVLVLKDVRGREWMQDDLSKPLNLLTSRQKTHWNTRPHVRPCSCAERSKRSGVLIQGQLSRRRTKIQGVYPHFRTSFIIGLMLLLGDTLDEILDSRNKETVNLNSTIQRSTVPNKTKSTWDPITKWRFGNQEYRIRILTNRVFNEIELQQFQNSFFHLGPVTFWNMIGTTVLRLHTFLETQFHTEWKCTRNLLTERRLSFSGHTRGSNTIFRREFPTLRKLNIHDFAKRSVTGCDSTPS